MTTHWRHFGRSGRAATLFLLILAAPVLAQSPSTGAVRGLATDATGEPLADALVTLLAGETGVARQAMSDRDGVFRFPFAGAGEYELFVERIGFTPVRLQGLVVEAGRTLRLETALRAAPSAAVSVDTLVVQARSTARFGGSERVAMDLGLMPAPRMALPDLARGSVRVAADGSSEGLPGMFGGASLDGVLFRAVRHPDAPAGGLATSPLSSMGLARGEAVTNAVDVEWGRAGGGVIAGATRVGGPRSNLAASLLVAPGAMSLASAEVTGNESALSLLGSASWSGPVLGDSARAGAGVTLRRLEVPTAAAWPATPVATSLAGSLGEAGARYVRAEPAAENSAAGWAALDWMLGQSHRILLSGHAGTASTVPLMGSTPFGAAAATDVAGSASLRSAIGRSVTNDLRVSLTHSERDADTEFATPAAWLATEAIAFGGSTVPARSVETTVGVSNAVQLSRGAAGLKLGVDLSRSAHTHQHRRADAGIYHFGDVASFSSRRGALVRTEGPAPAASWGTPRPALFAQLALPAGNGVEVVMGVRADREAVPSGNVQSDTAWLRQTGIDNTAAPRASWNAAPRVGIHWDVDNAGRWIVSAGGGLFFDRIDPLLLADWQINDGSGTVRRVVGDVPWPSPGVAAGITARSLTVLAPDFVPPRTGRATGSISHILSAATSVSISGTVRRTDNLPRRTDLNLLPLPAFRDQHGRGVFGTPVQLGGLLAAQPGTGRRFDSHDEVAGITADGWSDFWGLELGVEHEPSPRLGLVARYAYGQARDNWVGAATGGWLATLPAGFDGSSAWAEGPSDFDVPHRLAAGVRVAGPAGTSFGLLYGFQSGRPFTPGYRAGVDAAATGFTGPEPAFVDAALPGMDELIRQWPCLQASSGRFAARNACRAAASHSVDATIGAALFRGTGRSASLVLELVDLLESRQRVPDAALLLVDPARQLQTDLAARTVNVPLLVNPGFGEPLPQRYPGRMLRLGVELNW